MGRSVLVGSYPLGRTSDRTLHGGRLCEQHGTKTFINMDLLYR